MIDLGMVKPGSTVRIPFGSYDGGTGASVAASGFAAADIEIYKDGNAVQRASDAGYTATTSFDSGSLTGINLVEIDLSDNTTANFYEAGSEYFVVIGPITIDAQTVYLPLARFIIGYEGAILNTTIATLSSQTSFTLEDGSLLADAYVGCTLLAHQLDDEFDVAIGYISAYAVTTKTVTLSADPGGHTMAAGDNVSIFMPANVEAWRRELVATPTVAGVPEVDVTHQGGGAIPAPAVTGVPDVNVTHVGDTAQTAGDIIGDTNDIQGRLPSALVGGRMDSDVGAMQAGTVTAAVVATDAIDADALAADAVDEIWDEPLAAHTTLATVGQVLNGLAARTGAVNDAGPLVGDFDVDGFTEATDDHFNGMVMTFTSGALTGQSRIITDYTGSGQNCVFAEPWTNAPANNDEFIITDGPIMGATLAVVLRLFLTILDQSTGQIDAGSFAAGAIDAAAIATGAIDADALATDTITADKIAASAITSSEAPNLDAAISTRATPAQVNTEVSDVMKTDTVTLPGQTAPPLTPTFEEMISWLYKVMRNRKDQTSTLWQLYADNESTVDAKATVSDDGTTAIKQEIVSGP